MASYCYTHDNGNGTTGAYVLEEGDYEITLRQNSHDVIEKKITTIDETFWYDGSDEDHIRNSDKDAQAALNDDGTSTGEPAKKEADDSAEFVSATNEFEHANEYMTDPSVGNDVTILTRADWENTQPTAPTDETKQASDGLKDRRYQGTIILKIYRNEQDKNELNIWLIDDGIGIPDDKMAELNAYNAKDSEALYRVQTRTEGDRTHLGVINVISRLKLYYQENAEVIYMRNETGGTTVKIKIKTASEET